MAAVQPAGPEPMMRISACLVSVIRASRIVRIDHCAPYGAAGGRVKALRRPLQCGYAAGLLTFAITSTVAWLAPKLWARRSLTARRTVSALAPGASVTSSVTSGRD